MQNVHLAGVINTGLSDINTPAHDKSIESLEIMRNIASNTAYSWEKKTGLTLIIDASKGRDNDI